MRWIDNDQRDLVFRATGERFEAILTRIRRQIFRVN
jgi:hypothetical protein